MSNLPKEYIYKIYKSTRFLGVLDNVKSPFKYSLDLNTSATSITVVVGLDTDVASQNVEPLLDESSNILLDESDQILYEERRPDVIGSFNPDALIQEDNIVKVYEISDENPNGVIVFDGYIESWASKFSPGSEEASFIAVSRSIDMADYIIEELPTNDVSQTTGANEAYIFYELGTGWNYVGQSFVVGGAVDNITSITVKLKGLSTTPQPVTLSVYDNPYFLGTPIGTVIRDVAGTTAQEYAFAFAERLSVVSGTYYFSLTTTADTSNYITVYYADATNPYADGIMYNSNYSGGSGGGNWYPVPTGAYSDGSDLYFITSYSSGATNSPFSLEDPSNILTTIIDQYNSYGGSVTLDPALALTGNEASYTFKVNTVLEGVKKCLELAPSDWFYYVDPATNILYFKQTNTEPDHIFIRGRHLNDITIAGTVEQVRNIIYFTGGDTGSGNLYLKRINADSLANRRRRVERISDNRVTQTPTAELITDNFANSRGNTQYSSPIIINSDTYDISTINVGDTVKIAGFGNFIDDLILQIVRMTKNDDSVELVIGILLQRQSDALVDALSNLDKLQTVDNPSSPS